MALKGLFREIQGAGGISRRVFGMKVSGHLRDPSCTASMEEQACGMGSSQIPQHHSCWASLPPELLRDIIRRVEESESAWPSRRTLVTCAAVCSSWRVITKEIVKTPAQCGKLTFPVSLKQPGPWEDAMQCFIKRDRSTSSYNLYLGLASTLVENGKFLLAARRFRRTTSTEYLITLNTNDMSRASNMYVGKLCSNFVGTKFTIYVSQEPHIGAIAAINRAGRRLGSNQVSPKVPAGSYEVAHITYELNVLGSRGPRRMQCALNTVRPCLAIEERDNPTESSRALQGSLASGYFLRSRTSSMDSGLSESKALAIVSDKNSPLILKNKAPRWHEQLQCWCLNFQGRVTVASVKNFQLVAAVDPSQPAGFIDPEKVILQFGKIGKDAFTMDYRYPLSAFQAFAICLSSFDTKLACE